VFFPCILPFFAVVVDAQYPIPHSFAKVGGRRSLIYYPYMAFGSDPIFLAERPPAPTTKKPEAQPKQQEYLVSEVHGIMKRQEADVFAKMMIAEALRSREGKNIEGARMQNALTLHFLKKAEDKLIPATMAGITTDAERLGVEMARVLPTDKRWLDARRSIIERIAASKDPRNTLTKDSSDGEIVQRELKITLAGVKNNFYAIRELLRDPAVIAKKAMIGINDALDAGDAIDLIKVAEGSVPTMREITLIQVKSAGKPGDANESFRSHADFVKTIVPDLAAKSLEAQRGFGEYLAKHPMSSAPHFARSLLVNIFLGSSIDADRLVTMLDSPQGISRVELHHYLRNADVARAVAQAAMTEKYLDVIPDISADDLLAIAQQDIDVLRDGISAWVKGATITAAERARLPYQPREPKDYLTKGLTTTYYSLHTVVDSQSGTITSNAPKLIP
jgi:hypothetical protein